MCYQMIPLASYDERHFIGQCEHGTLHLNWWRLVLSFHPDEFLMIARTLRRYDPESRATLASPCVVLMWNSEEMVQLWLMRVGLYISADELTILLDLLAQACQNVIDGSPPLIHQRDLVREPGYRPGASPN